MKKIIIMCLALLLIGSWAFAQERGTKAEAQALVKKAIAMYKADGQEKAFAKIQSKEGGFVQKDLYVYVATLKSKDGKDDIIVTVHPIMAAMVGKSWKGLKDADGKPFADELRRITVKDGHGWLDYKWTNAVTKKVEAKTVYFEKEGDFVFVCGFYK